MADLEATHEIVEMRRTSLHVWECRTIDNVFFNVVKDADVRLNNFWLFEAAGYANEMVAMDTGDVITWYDNPVRVRLHQEKSGRTVVWRIDVVEGPADGSEPVPDNQRPGQRMPELGSEIELVHHLITLTDIMLKVSEPVEDIGDAQLILRETYQLAYDEWKRLAQFVGTVLLEEG